jgi:hypothetical protein
MQIQFYVIFVFSIWLAVRKDEAYRIYSPIVFLSTGEINLMRMFGIAQRQSLIHNMKSKLYIIKGTACNRKAETLINGNASRSPEIDVAGSFYKSFVAISGYIESQN